MFSVVPLVGLDHVISENEARIEQHITYGPAMKVKLLPLYLVLVGLSCRQYTVASARPHFF